MAAEVRPLARLQYLPKIISAIIMADVSKVQVQFQPLGTEQSGRQDSHNAVKIGRRGTYGNQRVHIRGAVPQGAPGSR